MQELAQVVVAIFIFIMATAVAHVLSWVTARYEGLDFLEVVVVPGENSRNFDLV